ncbi:isocitrate lyase/PEP mutase family protein [Arvimicrobium flavum]|uniref:isocitrate lyase/PEP mutase family protein n=1 Tax=Arvimicrobium flavum TaxID=3393320 RepID=UPI00237B8130|nr:isocitrate lyase/phosphoenolpyruvate mutase family protein [Mesorhizobium shangrilense]
MDKGGVFSALHQGPDIFVMPNPWDVGTAKLIEHCGFKALATSSAGYAWTRGLQDGAVGFEAMIAHCRDMAAAVQIPVSGDLEKGKGDSPDSAGETIFAADAAGLAGCSLEDHTGDPSDPIYEFSHAVERVAAAAEAARALKRGFVFTARAENFLWGRNDIDDTIRRLQAFERAGADVLFAPGISDLGMIRQICSAVTKPVSVLAGGPAFTVAGLAEAGVKRISLGPRLSAAAFGVVERAAKEILERGTFQFTSLAMPSGRIAEILGGKA